MNPLPEQPITEPESGGGLLLLRRRTPLPRRSVAYFCSGAHTSDIQPNKAMNYTIVG
jgi:hypothetical protein